MSSEYGFTGELKLDGWNSDAQSILSALKRGDEKRALILAEELDNSRHKHWVVTHRWEKAAWIIALLFIVAAVILGLASGEWVIAIVIGVIGLMLAGFIGHKIVEKRKAVYNAFTDTYNSLVDEINSRRSSN